MIAIPWGLLLVGHFLLGPIAFLAYAVWGWGYPSVADWSVQAPAVFLYILATALLIGCFALVVNRNRFARWTGYVAATIVWLGSGFLMSMILAYGA